MRGRLIVILALCYAAALAQTKPAPEQRPAVPASPTTPAPTAADKALWLERANLITAAIEEDASQLPPELQLILPGRLGDLWQRVDPKRAHVWMEQTVAKLTTRPETESADQQKARLLAGVGLWPELNKSDRATADHLLDAMVSEIEQTMPNDPRTPGRATVVSRLAIYVSWAVGDVSREDPQRAYGYATRIIQLSAAEQLPLVYVPLRGSDPQVADRFAFEALQAARTNYHLFEGLAQIAVPPDPQLPERLRAPQAVSSAILDTLAAIMLRDTQAPADANNVCRLTWAASMAMSGFKTEQQAQLRPVIESCKAYNPNLTKGVRFAENLQRTGTSSELMAQAPDVDDARSRAQIKQRAAQKALNEKEYVRALDIMDSLTAEEREASPDWKFNYRSLAMGAIQPMYRDHDVQGVQQVIARAPDEMRAYLQLGAAGIAFFLKDDAYALSMLTQARRDLEKSPVTNYYDVYLQLLNLYSSRVPDEAATVLRLAVDGINGFKKSPKGEGPMEPGDQLRPVGLRSGLLDADPEMVTAALAQLKSPQMRVAMRLGLLKLYLDRYTGPQPPPQKETRPPTKHAGGASAKAAENRAKPEAPASDKPHP